MNTNVLVISGKSAQVFKYLALLAKYQGNKTVVELNGEGRRKGC